MHSYQQHVAYITGLLRGLILIRVLAYALGRTPFIQCWFLKFTSRGNETSNFKGNLSVFRNSLVLYSSWKWTISTYFESCVLYIHLNKNAAPSICIKNFLDVLLLKWIAILSILFSRVTYYSLKCLATYY